jgi:CBS domain containing-hemolysin-like protein
VTLALVVIALAAAALLCLVTLVQLLYMESLRLRSRDLPLLQLFKETLEERIGPKGNEGALAFSLVKHTSLLMLGLLIFAIQFNEHAPLWQNLLSAALTSMIAMLVLTYVIPQVLYRNTDGDWLLPMTPFLHVVTILVRPLTSLLSFFQSLVELTQTDEDKTEEVHPAEQIEALISAGKEEGLIEEGDRQLIQSVVAFGDKTVREVMTPRPNIVAISGDKSLEDLRELVINEQYSRIPVYEGNIDNMIGFVHVRDMFELDEHERKKKKIRELVRPIRHVPETKPVNQMLREMQQDGAHMAIVVDEYGNTAGLATMEDLVEEILGEIRDEHEPSRDVTEEGEGMFVVSGSFDLDRLHELLSFRPEEETESTTVGGLMTEWLGHVPHVGEAVERDGLRMEALAGNELRVEQVRISKAEKKTHA